MSTDTLSGKLGVIDIAHHKTHAGYMFTVTDGATVGSGSNRDLLISTDSNFWHFVSDISTSGSGASTLYESATTSDNGTALTAYNNNRNSATSCGITFGHTPTVTGTGNAIQQFSIGANGGPFSFGGSAMGRYEWILKPNTKYLLRIASTATGNIVRSNVYVYLGGANI